MKVRRVVTGVAVVALVVGVFLGTKGMFPGGLGTGDGIGLPQSTQQSAEKAADPSPAEEPPEDVPPSPDALSADTRVLYVQIDELRYSVRDTGGKLRPAKLPEVVQLAKSREGNADGIKVRIMRSGSSKRPAEVSLQEKLVEGGVPNAAIDWVNGLPP